MIFRVCMTNAVWPVCVLHANISIKCRHYYIMVCKEDCFYFFFSSCNEIRAQNVCSPYFIYTHIDCIMCITTTSTEYYKYFRVYAREIKTKCKSSITWLLFRTTLKPVCSNVCCSQIICLCVYLWGSRLIQSSIHILYNVQLCMKTWNNAAPAAAQQMTNKNEEKKVQQQMILKER